jgi:hypothetical protein
MEMWRVVSREEVLYPSPPENSGNTEYNTRIGVFPLSIHSSRRTNRAATLTENDVT